MEPSIPSATLTVNIKITIRTNINNSTTAINFNLKLIWSKVSTFISTKYVYYWNCNSGYSSMSAVLGSPEKLEWVDGIEQILLLSFSS